MKLRIQGNSIRLRLSRSEVAKLNEDGSIQDALDFGAMGKLSYSLTSGAEFTFHCKYDPACGIALEVPSKLVTDWAETDEVAMSTTQILPSGATLNLLVEKDFQCLHKDDVENRDSYPNPLQTGARASST